MTKTVPSRRPRDIACRNLGIRWKHMDGLGETPAQHGRCGWRWCGCYWCRCGIVIVLPTCMLVLSLRGISDGGGHDVGWIFWHTIWYNINIMKCVDLYFKKHHREENRESYEAGGFLKFIFREASVNVSADVKQTSQNRSTTSLVLLGLKRWRRTNTPTDWPVGDGVRLLFVHLVLLLMFKVRDVHGNYCTI